MVNKRHPQFVIAVLINPDSNLYYCLSQNFIKISYNLNFQLYCHFIINYCQFNHHFTVQSNWLFSFFHFHHIHFDCHRLLYCYYDFNHFDMSFIHLNLVSIIVHYQYFKYEIQIKWLIIIYSTINRENLISLFLYYRSTFWSYQFFPKVYYHSH